MTSAGDLPRGMSCGLRRMKMPVIEKIDKLMG